VRECACGPAVRAELARLEPVVGATLLVATAFRLRDDEALISALRLLCRVIRAWEQEQEQDGSG